MDGNCVTQWAAVNTHLDMLMKSIMMIMMMIVMMMMMMEKIVMMIKMMMSIGTYCQQETLHICTTASYWSRAGSQGSPAMGTEVTNKEKANFTNISYLSKIYL